jgi:endoglucanase
MPKMMQRFAVRMAVALTTSLAAVVAGLVAASPAKADTWLRFVNERSGLCMGVSGGIMTPGRPIIQWPCNGNNDQYWGPYSSQTYTYLPLQDYQDPSYCLTASSTYGAQLVIQKCNGSISQQFEYIPQGLDGLQRPQYQYVSELTGTSLSVANQSTSNGAPIILTGWLGTDHRYQLWTD